MLSDPDLWVLPIWGVTASIKARPSERDWTLMMRAVELTQQRQERWMRWHYTRILSSVLADLSALENVPTDAQVQVILAHHRSAQDDVMRRMMLTVYPPMAQMVMGDDAKAYRQKLEVKRLTDSEHARLLAWVQEVLGMTVMAIDQSTLEAIRTIRERSGDDINSFRKTLLDSGMFSVARAERIAVTETNIALNGSLDLAGREASNGREMVKTWRTSGRTNVRDTHRQMAGVTIPNEDLYKVPHPKGGVDLMMYPSDLSHGARAVNTVNCHCKSFPRLKRYA